MFLLVSKHVFIIIQLDFSRRLRLHLEPFFMEGHEHLQTPKWHDDCKPTREYYLHVHRHYVNREAREQVFYVSE